MKRKDFLKGMASWPLVGGVITGITAAEPVEAEEEVCGRCKGRGVVMLVVEESDAPVPDHLPAERGPTYYEMPCPECRPDESQIQLDALRPDTAYETRVVPAYSAVWTEDGPVSLTGTVDVPEGFEPGTAWFEEYMKAERRRLMEKWVIEQRIFFEGY